MDQAQVEQALQGLKGLHSRVGTDWEHTILDTGLSLLQSEGPTAVQNVIQLLSDVSSGKATIAQIEAKVTTTLSLREASDFLAAMQSHEADRVEKTRNLLNTVLAVARTVADELLKLALRGGAP